VIAGDGVFNELASCGLDHPAEDFLETRVITRTFGMELDG
jgi:hypothetical protein